MKEGYRFQIVFKTAFFFIIIIWASYILHFQTEILLTSLGNSFYAQHGKKNDRISFNSDREDQLLTILASYLHEKLLLACLLDYSCHSFRLQNIALMSSVLS